MTGPKPEGETVAREVPPPSSPTPAGAAWEPAGAGDGFAERPEAYIGAAFGGGLALALLVRWMRS